MLHTYWCAVVFFKFHNISLKWCLNDGCSRQKLLFLGGIILKWAKQVKRQNTRQITTNIFAVQSEHIQEALSFFHLPHCQSERAPYKTPTCLSITTLGRWAGARQKRTRASESEGGWIRRGEPMWEWLKKTQNKPQGWNAGESRACGVIPECRSSLEERWMNGVRDAPENTERESN